MHYIIYICNHIKNITLIKNQYFKSIDGLRGISVLSVVLYHFFPKIFKGGFIGVDIFFIISGFVISNILLNEYKIDHKISLKNFYVKRIKRLFPAFFLVIFVSSVISYFTLLPNYLIDFSKSSLSSIFFISNFYFFFTNQDYAGIASNFKPLLHLWSLSAEEQFYIFFPLFIFVFLKFIKIYAKLTIVFLIIASYTASIVLENLYSGSGFYLLPSRVSQFLVGFLIAKFYFNNDKLIWLDKNISLYFLFSILITLFFIVFISDENLFPSNLTVLVTLCMFIIIYALSCNNIQSNFLENRILVFFGKISYSLYLWHFPIFVFSNYLGFLNNLTNKLIFLILSVIISFLSYNFYEKKFRYQLPLKNTIILSLILSLVIIVYSSLSLYTYGFKNRVPEILSKNYESIIYELRDEYGKICYDRKNNFCHLNKNKNKTKVAIVGDSHMAIIASKLNQITDFEMVLMINTGCYYLPNFILTNHNNLIEYERCSSEIQLLRKEKLEHIEDYFIVIGGRLPLYLSGKKFDNQEGGVEGGNWKKLRQKNKDSDLIKEIVDPIKNLSKKNKIILLYPIPELGWDINKKFFNNLNNNILDIKKDFKENFPIISTSYKVYLERNKESFKILDAINGENVYRVYPHKFFCNNLIKKRCVANNKKNLFYIDTDHLSDFSADEITKMIISAINTMEN